MSLVEEFRIYGNEVYLKWWLWLRLVVRLGIIFGNYDNWFIICYLRLKRKVLKVLFVYSWYVFFGKKNFFVGVVEIKIKNRVILERGGLFDVWEEDFFKDDLLDKSFFWYYFWIILLG